MDVQRLAGIAATLFGELGAAGPLTVRELPDGLGIRVCRAGVRGGGSIFVAGDESVLFVGSAMDFDAGLAAFRQGRRTPVERFRGGPDRRSAPKAP